MMVALAMSDLEIIRPVIIVYVQHRAQKLDATNVTKKSSGSINFDMITAFSILGINEQF